MNKKIIAMRKALLLIGFCALAISASAQNTALKVQSNGNIAIQTNSTAQSPISINDAGNSSYYIYCKTLEKNGMYVYADGDEESTQLYGGQFFANYSSAYGTGLSGRADYSDYRALGLSGYAGHSDECFGVLGHAYDGSTSIGVYGSFNPYNSSHACAAIYGTRIISAGSIYVGRDVTNTKPYGDVVLGQGDITLKADLLEIKNSTTVPLGTTLTIEY